MVPTNPDANQAPGTTMDLRYEEPSPPPSAAQTIKLGWKQPTGLIGLSFINFLLRIVTLGIYGFWAKTEVRKRIWSAIRIEGEPLHYTGTGKELFLGFLVVFFLVLLPIMASTTAVLIAFGPESTISDVYKMALYAVFFLLTGVAIYRAQRYRLSRTRWRAIRGALTGNPNSYAWTYFWTALLVPLTLGWALPWRATKLQGIMTRETHFGSEPFRFDATSGPLYARFAVLWVAAAVIFGTAIAGISFGLYNPDTPIGTEGSPFEIGPDGMPRPTALTVATVAVIAIVALVLFSIFNAWYRASQIRHFAEHTRFDGATFKSTVTAGGLIWIAVSNLVIVIGTLGLLAPIAQVRAARYMFENLEITGTVRLAEIEQGADQHIRLGEGLAQAFDVDAF
jgi:uncharacterized membrane protein YjgN (DUF898 family)